MLNEVDQVDCRPLLECEMQAYLVCLDEIRGRRETIRQALRSCEKHWGATFKHTAPLPTETLTAYLNRAVSEIKHLVQKMWNSLEPVLRIAEQCSMASIGNCVPGRAFPKMEESRSLRGQRQPAPRSRGFFSQAKVNARNAP